MSSDVQADKLAIREIIEQWVIFSDSGDWERFAALWHEDGWMTATWLQAQCKRFGANLTLSIGGPRESEAPGIHARAKVFVAALLERVGT